MNLYDTTNKIQADSKESMDSVYILPIYENYLIYAPLIGVTAFINESAALTLKQALEQGRSPENSELRSLYISLLESAAYFPEQETGDINPELLGIITTRFCNSACRYCDFDVLKATKSEMPLEMAVAIVDWYADIVKHQKNDVLKIHFFGGEPMIAPKVITTVVHRARLMAVRHGLIPEFEVSTNGQYDPKWAHFLGDYFDSVVLSFDGPQAIQNNHRPLKGGKKSFSSAARTAKIIAASQADLFIRVCVSQKNVDSLPSIAQWFCETFEPTKINFEVMQETANSIAHGLTKPAPYRFVSQFMRAETVASEYGVQVVYGAGISAPQWSSCPVGKDAVIATPDGMISSCYLLPERWKARGIELGVGHLDKGKHVQLDMESFRSIRKLVADKPRCRRCFCRWSCAGGCHVDNTWPGCSDGYSDFCRQTRLISFFKILESLDLNDEKDSIMKTAENLKCVAEQESDLFMNYNFENRKQ